MPFGKCPTCKRSIEYSPDNKWRPFCSERCKLIDLGQWAAEKHTIPVENIDEHTPDTGCTENREG